MKQTLSDKYSVAWFKLAECISKGERERAIGIYRLLSHSIDNHAFAKQLEGDIYLFFGDNQVAQSKYTEAAMLYCKQQQYVQATAIYEHLLTLDTTSIEYVTKLFECAIKLNNIEKLTECSQKLIDYYLQHNNPERAQVAFMQLVEKVDMHEQLISVAIKIFMVHHKNQADEQQVQTMINYLIDRMIMANKMLMLQIFLTQLENAVTAYYQLAHAYLQEK